MIRVQTLKWAQTPSLHDQEEAETEAETEAEKMYEFRVRIDGHDIVATPTVCSSELDHLLEKHNAVSFVFIPLARPGKKRKTIDKEAAKARIRAELPADDWYDGELRVSDNKHTIPGILAFNVRRRRAREIAEKAGVKLFFWGTSGAPVEQHAVKLFKDDRSYAWKTVRSHATRCNLLKNKA